MTRHVLTSVAFAAAVAIGCGKADAPPQETATAAQPPVQRTATDATQSTSPRTRIYDHPTDVVKLPTALVQDDVAQAPSDRLTVRDEKLDQQAEGPQTFDVRPDNTIAITDPLRDRVLIFDRSGTLVHNVDLNAPVRFVAAAGEGLRVAGPSETARSVDLTGKPLPGDGRGFAGPPSAAPLPPAAVRLDEGRKVGTIQFHQPEFRGRANAFSDRAPDRDLEVRVETTDTRLASMRVIAVDDQKCTYVSIETMQGDGSPGNSSLSKMIRRYTNAGQIDIEIHDVPIDYFIVPITEFRVVRDVVYQLLPHRQEVLINVWDLAK